MEKMERTRGRWYPELDKFLDPGEELKYLESKPKTFEDSERIKELERATKEAEKAAKDAEELEKKKRQNGIVKFN